MDRLKSLELDRPLPVVDQITRQVRFLIKDGRFKVGSKLPSTAELATMWDTDVRTVHRALTCLVREGLLSRKPGAGTFVRKRHETLESIVIYVPRSLAENRESRYLQAMQSAIVKCLGDEDIQLRVWFDGRRDRQFTWTELQSAANRREIQGVIVLTAGLAEHEWLSKLPVPVVFHSTAGIANCVQYDFSQLVNLSLETVLQRGCHSLGVISPLATDVGRPLHHANNDFFETLVDRAGSLKLEIRNPWIRALHDEHVVSHERFGYEQFEALWRQKYRPDALLVYPDSVARGVILAIAEQQVRVPEDLRLVLHKNAGIDYLCPFPVDFIVSDEERVARALINKLKGIFNGENVERTLVSFHRMKGEKRC